MGVVWTLFLSSIFSVFFLPLWETARYRLKYCLKGPLNSNQPTNLTGSESLLCDQLIVKGIGFLYAGKTDFIYGYSRYI